MAEQSEFQTTLDGELAWLRRRVTELEQEVQDLSRTQNELRESEALYRQFFDKNDAIKLVIDPHSGRIEDANPAASKFYGYSIAELRRMKITEINALSTEDVAREIEDARTEKRKFFQLPHRIASGELRLVEVFSGPVRYRGRTLLFSVVFDVTQRERAEQMLQQSEARFRSLIEQLPVAIAVHREGVASYFNPAAIALFGYDSAEALLGKRAIDLVHADDRELAQDLTDAALTHQSRPAAAELRFTRRDGHTVTVQAVLVPIHFDGADAVAMAAMDVTERRLLDEQLKRSQRLQAVGTLAGGIAHDFNNFLFVILNSARMLRRSLGTEHASFHDVERILLAGERATTVTRQLLLFSRGGDPASGAIDVNDVVEETRKLLTGALGEHIQMELSLADGPVRADISRPALEQVLVNLAVNARDAMPSGGNLRITTRRAFLDEQAVQPLVGLSPGSYVLIGVSDTGQGMPQEVVLRAFDPFFTTKEQGRGTGLGLALSYGIVQKAGGHIAIESTVGVGTAVTIYLPISSRNTSPRSSSTMQAAAPGRGEVVLVAEDELAVRNMVERMLSSNGYRVIVASTPGDAIEIANRTQQIDLLLTDIIMPGMSGPELAGQLAASRPQLGVLYVSGYPGEYLSERGLGRPDAELVNKPFTEAELLVRVRNALDARRIEAHK